MSDYFTDIPSIVRHINTQDSLNIFTRNNIIVISYCVSGYYRLPWRQRGQIDYENLRTYLRENKKSTSKHYSSGTPDLTPSDILLVLGSSLHQYNIAQCNGILIVISAYGNKKWFKLSNGYKYYYQSLHKQMRMLAPKIDYEIVKNVALNQCCWRYCDMDNEKLAEIKKSKSLKKKKI